MTDEERTVLFDTKKQEVIAELLGNETCEVPEEKEETTKIIDFGWNTHKDWHDAPRINSPMNGTLVSDYSSTLIARDSGGYIVTVEKSETLEETSTFKSKI